MTVEKEAQLAGRRVRPSAPMQPGYLGRNYTIMITNLPSTVSETAIWQLSSAIQTVRLRENLERPGKIVAELTFLSKRVATKFQMDYSAIPSASFEEPLQMALQCSKSVQTYPAYRTVVVKGLLEVNKFAIFSFADSLCNFFGHVRFPQVLFNTARSNEDGTKCVHFIFDDELDALEFTQFPHGNPFPGCRLALSRLDANGEPMGNFTVEPPETNCNQLVPRVIILFQDLPKLATEKDIIDLIGEEFIRLDKNENSCIKFFNGRNTYSAKVVMTDPFYAEWFVKNYDGELFHPFKHPITVCLN